MSGTGGGNGYLEFAFEAELKTYYDRRRKGGNEGVVHRVVFEDSVNKYNEGYFLIREP